MVPVTLANPFPVSIVSGGGSGGTASNFGSAFPGVGTAVGAENPSGNMGPLHVDGSGNLLISGNITASNPSVGTNGATAPTSSTELGFISSGNLVGVSAANPLPITGSISASNPSVSATGASVPASATYIGMVVGGNLTGLVGTANGLKVDGSAVTQPVSGTFFQATQPVSAASLPLPSGASTSALQTTGNTALTTINTTLGTPFQVGGSIANTTFASTQSGAWAVSVSNFPATQPISGSVSVSGTVAATQSGTWTNTVTQATAASLNATVVGTGTFACQAAQSGTWTVGLSTGSNAIGSITNTSFAATQSTASSLNAQVVGPTASGSSLTANPLTKGGRAATANPTAVTDGQVVNSMHDKLGKQVVVSAIRTLKSSQRTTITSSTAETTIVTSIAATFNDLYGLVLTNTSATVTQVDIRNTTGGTIICSFEVPANDTRGFMLPCDSGLSQTSGATNWTAQCGTSVASLIVTALYVQNT